MKIGLRGCLAAIVLLSCGACALGMDVKYKASGSFAEPSGAQHAWTVTESHTLIWDGEPYIPVGTAFSPASTDSGATEASYQADVKSLAAMKAKGITDLLLKSNGPLTLGDPAAWQKIISYLDANGFTYGIEMDDGPRQALSGYLVSPSRYRLEGPKPDTRIYCNWPDVDSAIYAVVNSFDNTIKAQGGAVVRDGKLRIDLVEPLASGQVLVVYPHKSFRPVDRGGTADIWSGFSDYRDRVLIFFKQIKFGSGLRFFLEPFTSKMDFTGEMAGFVPDSRGFRLGFEAYLTKKRIHEGAVNSAWGLMENLPSMEVAARLVPLWSEGRGIPYAYDRATAHYYPIDASTTALWQDMIDYRDSSALELMNTISDVLKRQVANVPVVFKAGAYHRIYANPFGLGGFDGLAVDAVGTGYVPVEKGAGPAYSLAEDCGKTTWFIVSGTRPNADPKGPAGYTDEKSMSATLDLLREVGCKGFFVDGMADQPGQLGWLKDFKDKGWRDSEAGYRPNIIDFPLYPATGAYVKQLTPNTWWLPTLRMGRTSYIGDGLQLYSLVGDERSYLWSSGGDKTVTFKATSSGYPSVEFPSSAIITKQAAPKDKDKGKKKGKEKEAGLFSITLTDVPVVLRGMDSNLIFPVETAATEVQRLADLIPIADKAGVSVKDARASLDSAKRVLANGPPVTAYGIAQAAIGALNQEHGIDYLDRGRRFSRQQLRRSDTDSGRQRRACAGSGQRSRPAPRALHGRVCRECPHQLQLRGMDRRDPAGGRLRRKLQPR